MGAEGTLLEEECNLEGELCFSQDIDFGGDTGRHEARGVSWWGLGGGVLAVRRIFEMHFR